MNQFEVNLQEAITALSARGWSQRRIARELSLGRETVARCVRAAKPAISTPGSDPAAAVLSGADPAAADEGKPAIPTPGSPAGRVSLCREFLPAITAAITAGLSARRIYQDLVSEHGFTGGVGLLTKSRHINVLAGTATFVSPEAIEVTTATGEPQRLTAPHFVIATGSVSAALPAWPFNGTIIISTEEALVLSTRDDLRNPLFSSWRAGV